MKPINDTGWTPREYGRERVVGPFAFQWEKVEGTLGVYMSNQGMTGLKHVLKLEPDPRYPHMYIVDTRADAIKATVRFVNEVYPGHAGRTRKK